MMAMQMVHMNPEWPVCKRQTAGQRFTATVQIQQAFTQSLYCHTGGKGMCSDVPLYLCDTQPSPIHHVTA